MAKKRLVDTKFWTDTFVINELNPLDKLAYIYLITNPYTSICGIYELPLKVMAVETGLDKENLEKVIIPRLESYGKVKYEDGWIAIKNFIKNQNQGSKDVKVGIERELEKTPESLQKWVNDERVPRGSREGLGTAPVTKLNLTKPNLTSIADKSAPDTAFNCSEYIRQMRADEKRADLRIIGHYLDFKEFPLETYEQMQTEIKRSLKAAGQLKSYSEERIMDVLDWLWKNADFKWTLETVGKYINEDLSKIKVKPKQHAQSLFVSR